MASMNQLLNIIPGISYPLRSSSVYQGTQTTTYVHLGLTKSLEDLMMPHGTRSSSRYAYI